MMARRPGIAIISHPAAKLARYVWSLKLRKLLIYEVKAQRRLLTSLDLTPSVPQCSELTFKLSSFISSLALRGVTECLARSFLSASLIYSSKKHSSMIWHWEGEGGGSPKAGRFISGAQGDLDAGIWSRASFTPWPLPFAHGHTFSS